MFENFINSGIIEPQDLYRLREHENLRILDCTYSVTQKSDEIRLLYQTKHIAGARFFSIEDVSDKTSLLPHMLPPASEFAAALCELGIQNDDFIVVYGQKDMIMGPARVWWMLRVLGHDRVAVLNGSLHTWEAQGYPVSSAPTLPQCTNYNVGAMRRDLVADKKTVQQATSEKTCPILDARPKPRFDGEQPEPRAGLRMGHIEGSINLPAASLIDPQSGKLKSTEELNTILKNIKSPVIATCGSGVTACMIALALFNLGQPDVAVYDGSWAEWGQI